MKNSWTAHKTLTRHPSTWLACMAIVMAVGCGADSSEFNCETGPQRFTACGGDVVGSWEVVESCPTMLTGGAPLALEADCPAATTESFVATGGAVDIDDAYLQWRVITFSYVEDVLVPASCVDAVWAGDCANVAAALEPRRPGVVCTAIAEGCTCHHEESDQDDTQESYSYSIVDGNAIYYGTGENDRPSPYCVTGNEMIWEVDTVIFGIQYLKFQRI